MAPSNAARPALHFNRQNVAAIAELCLGMPNRALSTKDELRFGNNGSVSVALLKATYFDHEASAGGGMLDLILKKRGLSGRDAIEWLRKEGINVAESSNGAPEQKSRAFFVEAFDYKDENGALLFQVVRQEFRLPCGKVELSDNGKPKKTFKQRRPDPDHPGKWIWRTQGIRKVLYRLPQLIDDMAEGRTILIVEGERKVDLLRGWGFSATCSPGGGGVGKPGAGKKWLDAYSLILSNAADIIILPDADKTGEEYRDCVAASLAKVGTRVRILDLPGLGPKGDVVDWAAAGGTAEMLKDLVETDTRPWVRPNDHNADDGAPVFVSRGPAIYMAAGQLERLVNETEAAVIAAERGLYQRGGQIVRIGEAQLLGADEKPTTSLVIQAQDEHTLLEDASASATFMKYDARSEGWGVANPTSLVIKAWQGRSTRLRLPLLSGVISTPLILKSGRIIERPGYDEGTGFYFEPGGTIFPPVPTAPTRADALAALSVLSELIAEFPFVDEASRSVALSGLLTAVSRRAMDFAFLHGVTAPAYGSGKSYLVDLFCMLATGRTAPVIPQPKAPEEFEKRLDAQLLRGVSHIAIDNVDKPLEGDKLCQILTQRFVEIRPLGSSQIMTTEPAAFVTATGVNLLIVEDLRRRSILCSLDANQERPELRCFRKDPIKMVQENRGSYVAAALTILRAFIQAGRPPQAQAVNGGDYSQMVRDPLIWLGCVDPCQTMETIQKQDSKLETRKQVAACWRAVLGETENTAREIVEEASRCDSNGLAHPEFFAALAEIASNKAGGLDAVPLGNWLRRVQGGVFSLFLGTPRQSCVLQKLMRLHMADSLNGFLKSFKNNNPW